ncbi:hypothetical protein C8T65DRAFT_584451 [Cerioporus squamosus]|nr:hypothetical protein C8T65DRAFT_584451 [Cerioporus squamosus]
MRVVPRHGWLVGSSASLHRKQRMADIYFDDIWDEDMNEPGDRLRIATQAAVWGMSFVNVETTTTAGSVLDQEWAVDAGNIFSITVTDHGQQHLHRPDVPFVVTAIQPPHLGAYWIGDVLVPGWRLPWHHLCHVRRTPLKKSVPPPPLHYHQHVRRKDKQLEVPDIMPGGKHWTFGHLRYGTQVQNYRRAMGRKPGGVPSDSE